MKSFYATYTPTVRYFLYRVIGYIFLFTLFVIRNVNRFITINGHYMAAAIAFYTMLCLFPASLMVLSIASLILGDAGTETIITALIEGLSRVFPVLSEPFMVVPGDPIASGNTTQAQSLIDTLTTSLNNFTGFSGTLAIVFTALASTAVFSSVRKSINLVWGINHPRSFLVEKFIDIILSIGAVFLLFLSVALSTIGPNLQNILNFLFPNPNVEINVNAIENLVGLFSLILELMVFWVLYWWLPATKVKFWHVLPTALGATIAFEINKFVFTIYLSNVGGLLGTIYGVFATVIVFLGFMYVSAIILLAGAMMSSRFTRFLSTVERKRLNENLSNNLRRVRNSNTLADIPNILISKPDKPTPQKIN